MDSDSFVYVCLRSYVRDSSCGASTVLAVRSVSAKMLSAVRSWVFLFFLFRVSVSVSLSIGMSLWSKMQQSECQQVAPAKPRNLKVQVVVRVRFVCDGNIWLIKDQSRENFSHTESCEETRLRNNFVPHLLNVVDALHEHVQPAIMCWFLLSAATT